MSSQDGGVHHDIKDDDIIELNIGGTEFTATRATLCYVKDSTLAAMFSGKWQNDHLTASGKIFLNYNPVLFIKIIKYFQMCIILKQVNDTPHRHRQLAPTFETLEESEEFETLCDFLGVNEAILLIIRDDNLNVANFAAQHNEFDISEIIYSFHEPIASSGPNAGKTWLIVAVIEGNRDVIIFLLQHDVDVDAVDLSNHTALCWASSKGYIECMKLIIDGGADVNQCDDEGHSPAHIAAQNGYPECLKLLFDNGAEVNECDDDDYTPAHTAAQNGHTECLKVLVEYCGGVDIHEFDSDGYTSLHKAAQNGHVECLKFIIACGADVNECGYNGVTPTCCAAAAGHIECLTVLIDCGADVNQCNEIGCTPTIFAAANGHANCIQLLFDANANILTPVLDKTPLRVAKDENNDSCVELLSNLMKNLKSEI